MNVPLEITFSVILMGLALMTVWVRDLLALTVLLSAYSGVLALVFAMLGAPDVAFTEAVVGAGVSTGLLVALLRRVDARLHLAKVDMTPVRRKAAVQRNVIGAVTALALGALLLYGVFALPPFGDPTAVTHEYLSAAYSGRARIETATPNLVTAVLGDYRSFDTLIETAVVLAGAVGCLLILRQSPATPGQGAR
jgi:multicomponent Na+:H+ antiporter subunit B